MYHHFANHQPINWTGDHQDEGLCTGCAQDPGDCCCPPSEPDWADAAEAQGWYEVTDEEITPILGPPSQQQLAGRARWLAAAISNFDAESEQIAHTDTTRAWELLRQAQRVLAEVAGSY